MDIQPEVKNDLKKIFISFLIIMLLLFMGSIMVSFFKGMTLQEAIKDTAMRVFFPKSQELSLESVKENLPLGLLYLLVPFISIGITYYLGGALIHLFLKSDFGGVLMSAKRIRLRNHFIVCGAGRVGENAAKRLKEKGKKVVVIESATHIAHRLKKDFNIIEGDALTESTLKKARVEDAKGLIAALGKSEDNAFLIISAKHINPNLYVIARANSFEMVPKLKYAGADAVIMPEVVGGRDMANMLISSEVKKTQTKESKKRKRRFFLKRKK